jgi:hypothetical protein
MCDLLGAGEGRQGGNESVLWGLWSWVLLCVLGCGGGFVGGGGVDVFAVWGKDYEDPTVG